MKRFNPYKVFNGVFIPEAIIKLPIDKLSHGAKICYGRLLRFAGEDGKCYPKIETLAVEIGVGEESAKLYLRELKDFGLIEAERQGLGLSNVYFFLWHDIFERGVGRILPDGGVESYTIEVQNPTPHTYKESHNKKDTASGNKTTTLPEEIQQLWNKFTDWQSLGVAQAKIRNQSVVKKLLPEFRRITPEFKLALKKRNVKIEEAEIAVKNYIKDIVNRIPDKTTFHEHRFSCYEFFKQENGFIKFLNK
jgi:hypothetical protein